VTGERDYDERLDLTRAQVATLEQQELEVWILHAVQGCSFRRIHELYAKDHADGLRAAPAPSLSTLHGTYHQAERKLQQALGQEQRTA
jgi:hypothetical protein